MIDHQYFTKSHVVETNVLESVLNPQRNVFHNQNWAWDVT